eukprot:8952090-Pyramimonas_sp.AAC.1
MPRMVPICRNRVSLEALGDTNDIFGAQGLWNSIRGPFQGASSSGLVDPPKLLTSSPSPGRAGRLGTTSHGRRRSAAGLACEHPLP